MKKFWNFTLEKLESNYKIVLLTVVKAQGSTPGRQGFKMVISEDKTQFGTIGGGIMELNFIKLADEILVKNVQGFNLKIQTHHKYAPIEQQSGLVCSGEEWIIYGLLLPTQENKDLCKNIINIGKKSTLHIKNNSISVNEYDNIFLKDQRYNFDYESESKWIFSENLSFKNKMYIFGGGHVGLALSQVFSKLDFYTTMIDNRNDVETIKNNYFTDKTIIDDYNNAGTYVEEGNSSYVVVVTTSMITDTQVLASCLNKHVKYIGVMGSKSKKKEIFSQLSKKGFSNDELEKIKCPIGINDVKTHSAEEIAISVATEIIKLKNT
jgi:xanthine dehydrogenase accessory factor